MNDDQSKIGVVDWVFLIGFLVITFGAGAVGSLSPIGEWYENLIKPQLAPPNWIFGPVWTALYLMMAIAAWLVWRRGRYTSVAIPLVLYVFQLVLNSLWSWLFFGQHRIDLALLNIILLFFAILTTAGAFARHSKTAATLLLPYLAWVGFASYLNFSFWKLNM